MWVIDWLVILLSPYPETPACPSTPKVLWAKECAPTLYPSVVYTFKLIVESTKELGVRQWWKELEDQEHNINILFMSAYIYNNNNINKLPANLALVLSVFIAPKSIPK